jgi:hypothetical protein
MKIAQQGQLGNLHEKRFMKFNSTRHAVITWREIKKKYDTPNIVGKLLQRSQNTGSVPCLYSGSAGV